MDKYGVEEMDEKTAEDSDACPECDAEVSQHGRVKLCPNCGSKPFEPEEKEEEEEK